MMLTKKNNMIKFYTEVIGVTELYHCDISKMSDEEFLNLYAHADKNRQNKADRLRNNPDKKLSIAAGELVRKAVSEKFNIDKNDIRFRVGKNGKPYIENIDIEFSISHSGDIAMCAISDKPVGLDIEKIRDININVVKRMFAADEQRYVLEKWSLSKQRFFEVWTRKEAYAKMLGKGVVYFPEFSTMGNKNIKTYIREKYIVSVAETN